MSPKYHNHLFKFKRTHSQKNLNKLTKGYKDSKINVKKTYKSSNCKFEPLKKS